MPTTSPVNLALNKPVTASSFLPDFPPSKAVDGIGFHSGGGSIFSLWVADGKSPQWIEIDLQVPSTINSIRLSPGGRPSDKSSQRVLVRDPSGPYTEVHEFKREVDSDGVLVYIFDNPLKNIQYIKIETADDPAAVIGWTEIEVFGSTQ